MIFAETSKEAAKAVDATGVAAATAVKTAAETATAAITATGDITKTGLKTAKEATDIAAQTGLEGAKIASQTGIEGAKVASEVGLKAAKEIGTQTAEAASLINKELGIGAASLTKEGSKMAVDLTKVSGEGATELAKTSFQGVGDIAKDSFGIIRGVFSAISGTGKFVKDSIANQIQRSREFQDIQSYIQKYGLTNHLVEKKIRSDITRLSNVAAKTLEGILNGLYKALDDSFYSYRMTILCRRDGLDLFYSNRGMGAKPTCATVKKPNNANVSPVQEIEKIIKDIKIKIETGVFINDNTIVTNYEIVNKNILGFNSRIGFIKSLRNLNIFKKEGESNIDAYHRFYRELAENIEQYLNIDDLSKYFNYRADILNETMEEYILQLNPSDESNTGGKRKTRKQHRRRRQTSKSNRGRRPKRRSHRRHR